MNEIGIYHVQAESLILYSVGHRPT